MQKIPYFKFVGGYTAFVKLRGRWHYVGRTAPELFTLMKSIRQADMQLCLPASSFRPRGTYEAEFKKNYPRFYPRLIS